ncbi:MAG: two-component system, chemotaxis family, protein-glutamate methylesterase/glutaminase [Thermodesulfobacteriota bacterium]|nr:two-component system, chemotaxis family, protein-glutamate methylesterase/glutaminase [Thermodesulfobacteriota bacterium]
MNITEWRMIRVLIVDDSVVVRELLTHILNADPEIEVIGAVTNGQEAVDFVEKDRPDVITMDLDMPKMGGFEATRKIMETKPVPIVILTASWDPHDVNRTWKAMEAGAVHALEKPVFFGDTKNSEEVKNLIQTIKLMSEVKVVRRWPNKKGHIEPKPDKEIKISPLEIDVVAIGASTGGPPVIKTILGALPESFPVPILLVQHIAPNFSKSFVEWLDQTSALKVKLAVDGDRMASGFVYVAPDQCQMKVERYGRISLTKDGPENGLRPSVSYLFRSVAHAYGSRSLGILLTGMGKDGAEELRLLKTLGAITVAQDKESSIVHGMPGEAIKLGGATHIMPPERIVEMLSVLGRGRLRT